MQHCESLHNVAVDQVRGDDAKDLGPHFSALLAASVVSNLGDGLRLTALPLLAATLTSSPLLIAGIAVAQYLPWTTFAPFGGVIVDRSNRRRLIMITQTWRATVMVLLFVLVATDVAQIWHLYVVAFVITAGEILVDPSVVATVPTLVTPAALDRANGRISTVETVTNEFVGGPVGAAAFAFAPWLPFLLDGLSYLGSVAPFSRLPAQRSPRDRDLVPRSIRAEIGEGLRWIRGHPFLWPFTMALTVFYLGTAGAFVLLVVVVDILDAPPIIFGLTLTTAAVGATLATMIAARLAERFSRRIVITAAASLAGLSVLGVGAATSNWHLIAAWTFNGASSGAMLAIGRSFIQRYTPNDRLGRAAIASRMITRSSFGVGALLIGAIADVISVRWAYVVAAAFHLVGAVLLWRAFRHEPTEPAMA